MISDEKCSDCGGPMGADEAKVFTCCSPCWDRHYKRPATTPTERDRALAERLVSKLRVGCGCCETSEALGADVAAIARALAEARAEVDRPGIYCRNNHAPIWHPRGEPCPMCEAAPRWIPVTERMPERGAVIVTCLPGWEPKISIGSNKTRGYWLAIPPLPTPPEEK